MKFFYFAQNMCLFSLCIFLHIYCKERVEFSMKLYKTVGILFVLCDNGITHKGMDTFSPAGEKRQNK